MPATKKNIKTIVKTKNTKKIKQQPKLIPFTTLIKKGTIHRGSGGSSNFIIVYKNTVLKIIPNF